MLAFKSVALFLTFAMGAMACRSASTSCGGKWAATGYFGDAINAALGQIPDNDGFRFKIPTSGDLWHKCGQVTGPGRFVQSAVQVYSKCDGCGYEAFGNEIHCYANQALNDCGSGTDWTGDARVCNDYYCVELTACLD
ncbi:hypothetical protein [Absidia glauca]|uniref:Uncharacterized protein n=1 Tax=Absidia glauca TaxID=4829 RepID=A0A168QCZ6_ABSGL|nr:hypothetical protein [Absidia glauca]